MKQLLQIFGVALLVTACASSGGRYMAADEQGDYGSFESKLENNRYRVVYTSRGANLDRARDYALLRASELTLQNGYNWFEIVSRDTDIRERDNHNQAVATMRVHATTYRECGVLACRTVTRPAYIDTQYADNFPERRASTATIIEVVMGTGSKPEGGQFYDAQTLANTIRDRI
jgi:hypothetical protein